MEDIADAVAKNFGTHASSVTVQMVESSRVNKAKGGVLLSKQ